MSEMQSHAMSESKAGTTLPAPSTLLATASTYIQVFTTLDPSTISSIQTSTYRHEWAPTSANPPATRNRETFASHLNHLRGIMQSFPVRSKQMWANPSLSQVVVWADSETVFHKHVRDNDDEEEWRYRGEYVFMLTMDQSGERVDHVLEFLDSKGTDRLRGLVARAWKKKNETEGKGHPSDVEMWAGE